MYLCNPHSFTSFLKLSRIFSKKLTFSFQKYANYWWLQILVTFLETIVSMCQKVVCGKLQNLKSPILGAINEKSKYLKVFPDFLLLIRLHWINLRLTKSCQFIFNNSTCLPFNYLSIFVLGFGNLCIIVKLFKLWHSHHLPNRRIFSLYSSNVHSTNWFWRYGVYAFSG